MLYFIINTHARSGGSRRIWEKMLFRLNQESIPHRFFLSQYAGHAVKLADEVCHLALEEKSRSGRISLLVAVGGDGTFNEIINGMHHFDMIRLAVIPLGSGNDLGRGLGIAHVDPLQRLEEILHLAHELQEKGASYHNPRLRRMDLGRLELADGNSRLFAISCGIGFDAAICREAGRTKMKQLLNRIHLGALCYLAIALKTILSMPFYRGRIHLQKDGQDQVLEVKRLIFMAAMNQPVEGGGIRMCPDANAFDQSLGICLADSLPRMLALLLLPFVVMGKHRHIPGVHLAKARKLHIRMEEAICVHSDGEDMGMHRELCISCLEAKLWMFI